MKYKGSMDAVDVIDNHTAESHGHYCKCGKQAPLGGAKGWYANHLIDALRDNGYVLAAVSGTDRAEHPITRAIESGQGPDGQLID